MRSRLTTALIATIALTLGMAGTFSTHQTPTAGAAGNGKVTVIHARRAGIGLSARALRRMAPGNALTVGDSGAPNTDSGPDGSLGRGGADLPIPIQKRSGFQDPLVQRGFSAFSAGRAAVAGFQSGPANFDGLTSASGKCGCAPSDTNAAVGLHDIVEIVNAGFAVYAKTGSLILPPTAINAIFFGLGGPCQDRNDGDPIVLYDSGADRWLISEFTTAPPYAECVAISSSGDPAGSYYRYEFDESSVNFGDYPKIGIWPVSGNNVYAMTTNEFADGSGFSGPELWMMDRARMLTGDPTAVMVGSHPLSAANGAVLPADADQSNGPEAPSAGSPEFFLQYPLGFRGTMAIYEGRFNEANPSASTFAPAKGTPPDAGGFNNSFTCGPTSRDCIPQPGSVNHSTTCTVTPAVVCNLDPIADRFMYRLAYRRLNGVDSLLGNFTVNVASSGNHAAPQWFEIQNPAGAKPSIVQQGAYAPNGLNRWMGSVDMDRNGDILLGYSVSNSSVYPGIRVAGRSPGDPAGKLGPEVTVFSGSKSQSSVDRWGDYSSMRVDPTDGCTFWYAQEYAGSGPFSWATRIASFRFPGCESPAASAVVAAPGTISAGSVAKVTVTMQDARGYDASAYRGTVHLSSSDTSAGLPSDYIFTADDSGSHTFDAVFGTQGPQTVTAEDTANPAVKDTASIQVTAPAAAFAVSLPAMVGKGNAFPIKLIAKGVDGLRLSNYTGTVHFTSSDPYAVLPPDYTFTAADAGAHTFSSAGPFLTGAVSLFSLGTQTIQAVDTGTPSITGQAATQTVIINTFVSTGGKNSNNCQSAGAPCKSINAAIEKASYDGTVSVRPGTYAQDLTIDRDLTLLGTTGRASGNIVDGEGRFSTVVVDPGMRVTISNLQIQNGNGSALGAGGGIANFGASLTLRNVVVTGNTDTGGLGGGIYNDNANDSVLNIYDSTISRNSAANGTGPAGAIGLGGAIYDRGRSMLIVDSTITGNSAGSDGGIRFRLGPATVLNSTINGNSARNASGNSGAPGAGGVDDPAINGSRINFGNTIISGNTVKYATLALPNDCNGSFSSAGHNFIGDGQDGSACSGFLDGVKGDIVGNDGTQKKAKLGRLGNNGGLTPTERPGPGSRAINAGSKAICSDASTVAKRDQRAFTRQHGRSGCDIGAVESDSPGLPHPNVTYLGPITAHQGSSLAASAKLTSPLDGSAVVARSVSFRIGSQSCFAVTNSNGIAACTISSLSASAGKQELTEEFRGDPLGPEYAYGSARATVPISVS